MEAFICRKNIAFYKERLQRERDERARKALAVLLRMEEAKLAQMTAPNGPPAEAPVAAPGRARNGGGADHAS